MRLRNALAAVALCLSANFANAQNASQTPVAPVNCSTTIAVTNTWQRLLTQNTGRKAINLANPSTRAMGIWFAPVNNNGVAPSLTIAQAGVFPLPAAWYYEPDGGFLYYTEVWVIGTATDPITCTAS